MIYILDKISGKLVESEIVQITDETLPLKKDGWNFDWKQLSDDKNGEIFVLKTTDSPSQIEGILQLKIEFNMLIMNTLELAPHNIGRRNKRYDYIAGCLIAFACRESVKIEGPYKAYLTFVSKSNLIQWYIEKYGAELAIGQRMYIDWKSGEKLIEQYLNRTKYN